MRIHSSFKLWAVGVAVSVIFSFFLSTQRVLAQGGAVGVSNVQFEPLRADPISVSATRNSMRAFEYPGMVSVIEKEEIDLLQPSTVDDILKWIPNVEFTGGPRRTGQNISIRGFSGADLVITIDGARQNYGSGHDGRFFVDPSLLRGVEVLRGSASSLYGSGGTGGVLSFRTVEASDYLAQGETSGYSFSSGFESVNNEAFGTLQVFGRPKNEWDVIAAVTKRNSGAITLGDGSEITSTSDDILSVLLKAGWDFHPHQNLEASFQQFHNDAEEPNNGQGAGGSNLTEKNVVTDNYRLSYKYDDPSNKLAQIDATVYYTQFQVDELRLDSNNLRFDEAGGRLSGGPKGELIKRDLETLGFRIENRTRYEFGDDASITLTYGAEAYTEEQDGGADETKNGERDGVPDADANFIGGFVQAEYSLDNLMGIIPGNFLIIPGVRYDHFDLSSPLGSPISAQAVSPRIGVSYFPTDWSMLFASYGSAFRAPTINEVFLTGVHFAFPGRDGLFVNRFVPNPDLKPQSTDTLEFGFGLDFKEVFQKKDRFKLKVSHFRTNGEDFINLSVSSDFRETRSSNIPRALLWGTEVETSYENNRFNFVLGYSTVNGENVDTGAKLGSLTPGQVTLNAGLKLPEIDSLLGWKIFVAADFDEKAAGRSEEQRAGNRRPGYVTHDFYYSWKPREGFFKGMGMNLAIDNAFDKAYSRIATGALQPGRNFKASLSYIRNF